MSFLVPGITHCEKHMKRIDLINGCEDCEKERKNMTNREWLLNKMKNMSDEEFAKAVYKPDLMATELDCENVDCRLKRCLSCKIKWLKSEHKQKPNLSQAERIILENIDKEYKWIARDGKYGLYVYASKPKREGTTWIGVCTNFNAFNHLFQFITWNDEEPYSIEELLKGD